MKAKGLIFGYVFILALLIPVSGVSDFLQLDDYFIDYTYDETVSQAGERFTLTVTITNEDNNPKDDIEFELQQAFPFEILSDEEWSIGTLISQESVSRTFRMEISDNAESKDYDLEFTLDDSDDDFEDAFQIEVTSNDAELIIGHVNSLPAIISPDLEDIKLTISLENIGDGSAEFVRARLVLPAGFTPSSSFSNTAFLGTIASGSGKEVIFFIDSDENLNANLYEGKIELEFESDDPMRETLTFDLPVKGRPQFRISNIELIPNTVTPDFTGATVKITIQNFGQEEGRETSIRVFEKGDQPFNFDEKTSFIGNLQSGSIGTGLFTFDVDEDAVANSYLVKLQIRTVSEGNVLISEETINLNVGESVKKGNGFSFLWLIVIILAILVLFILYRLVRFSKRKSK